MYKILPNEIIGSGERGKIFLTSCIINNELCYDYATKIPASINEIKISEIASKHKIGPKVFKSYEDENGHCLVMEKLNGDSLGNIIIREDIHIDKQISDLLISKIMELHKLGWLHCDLHPGNIFVILDENMKPIDIKIIDFDITEKIYDTSCHFKDFKRLLTTIRELRGYNLENVKELINSLKIEVNNRRIKIKKRKKKRKSKSRKD